MLRGAGAVLPIDLANGHAESAVPVCAEPRGLAVAPHGAGAWVACRSGELVQLDAEGQVLASGWVDTDLRDVVAEGGQLWVSRLRSAEVLRVDPVTFAVLDRWRPPIYEATKIAFPDQTFHYEPRVGWRMIAHPDGGVALVHQLHQVELVEQAAGGASEYYGPPDPELRCEGIVLGRITRFRADGTVESLPPMPVAVPFDLAVGRDGRFVVAAMGGVGLDRPANLKVGEGTRCAELEEIGAVYPYRGSWVAASDTTVGGALAVDDRSPLRTRFVVSGGLPLDAEPFQRPGSAGIACASCHPDGQDDGHVWTLAEEGGVPRRTPALSGGLSETAPFHWSGQHETMASLWSTVGVVRMGLAHDSLGQAEWVTEWLDAVASPAPAVRPDPALVDAGARLFSDPTVGCVGCHPPPTYTDDRTYDVGTGEALQVPSLRGVSARLPVMHDGCARTLMDRFTDPSCGGGDAHGVTSHLTAADLDALVAFLQSL